MFHFTFNSPCHMTDHLTLHLRATQQSRTSSWAGLALGLGWESQRKPQAIFEVQGQRSKAVEPNLFSSPRGDLQTRSWDNFNTDTSPRENCQQKRNTVWKVYWCISPFWLPQQNTIDEIYFSQFWRVKSKIRVQHGRVLVRVLFLACTWLPSCYVLT